MLIGLGLFGIWLAARFALGRHWGAYSILLYGGGWHALVMLLLALGFLAAGLWLAPRTGLYPRCRRVLSRARWSAPGWGLLLIPLAAACFGLFGSTPWTWGFAVFAVLAAVLLPVLAADLAPLGLLLLGLYAIRLPSLSSHSTVARFLRKSWVVVQPAPTRAQQIQALQLRQHAAALMNQAAALQRQAAGLLRQAMQLNGKAAGPVQWRMTAGRLQVQAIGPGGGPGVVKGQGFVTAVPFRGPGPVPPMPPKLPPGIAAMKMRGVTFLPPDHIWYGFVRVGMPYWAALAAVEAVLFVAFGLWLVPRTLAPHAQLGTRYAALEGRVRRLAQTRTDAVDAAASELRRVERDLHDGAQARLVAVGMSLRAAERTMEKSPNAALALIAEARESSAKALAELRDLVRGIHPPVLADRGLGDAIRALALDTPLRTDLDIDLPGRPEAPVETAAYFAVAEVIANAVKHAGARRLEVRVQHHRGVLRIMISDDGAGGADPGKGTGLRGVERRLAAFDGILAVSSPPGGPTIVAIEVPCALSSPKTFSC